MAQLNEDVIEAKTILEQSNQGVKAYILYIKNETVAKCQQYTNKNLKSLECSLEGLYLK
jgi:hypothetical protein